MADVFTAEKVDPSTLDGAQRQELSEMLYRIHAKIFSGLDEKGFDHYVVNSPAAATRIFLYRDKQKQLVGYLGVHRFEKNAAEQPVVIFRAEAGLLPGYRQRDANLSFWLLEAARFKVFNPRKSVYFLYAPVSPSFYAMVARHSYQIYPRHDAAIPSRILTLMTQFAQQFGLNQADEENPLIRQVGWITKATGSETQFWQSSPNPHVRFYIHTNPKFAEGNGLLTLIPITLVNLALSLPGVAFHALKKKFRVTFNP
ncbi:MAG: hypothetical protein H6R26_1176 [Proteobacteria bacterium]|nr:hypothetical protein [Pseudomonadota bacterium]